MTEAIEQAVVHTLPLDEMHRQLGAEMMERDGWWVPANYGDPAAEYDIVRTGAGAGLIDLSPRGRIEVSGAEAVQFLNGMITNDVKTLADGAWMAAAFPTVQGRLVASVRVTNRGGAFLFDTELATHERVLKTLERFTLAGDFKVRDITGETALLSVQGAGAAEIVGAALGETAARTERGQATVISHGWGSQPFKITEVVPNIHTPENEAEVSRLLNAHSLTVVRATHTSEDGFDIYTSAGEAPALVDALLSAGARPFGYDALEVLRIEAGIPRFGVDMSEANVVLEAVPDEAVSFTKGCYIGQEIIARIHWRGHVARKLTGLISEARAELQGEAKVKSLDGKEIGRVTSSVFSPRAGRAVALAYIRYNYLEPGTEVRVIAEDGGESVAHVASLPLVRGSWYGELAA